MIPDNLLGGSQGEEEEEEEEILESKEEEDCWSHFNRLVFYFNKNQKHFLHQLIELFFSM